MNDAPIRCDYCGGSNVPTRESCRNCGAPVIQRPVQVIAHWLPISQQAIGSPPFPTDSRVSQSVRC